MPSLRSLDVRDNQLIHFYPEFITNIKGGMDLRYSGNILRCECSLRPVVEWLSLTGVREGSSWDSAFCHSPGYLAGRAVSQVREEQLVCDSKQEADHFKISPDVKFREITQTDSSVKVKWFVNTNEDVGDFRVELATLGKVDKSGERERPRTLLVKELGYTTRYDVIDAVPTGEQLRMCLKVKTSLGRIRRWRQDQCEVVGPFSAALSSHQPNLLVTAILLFIFKMFS